MLIVFESNRSSAGAGNFLEEIETHHNKIHRDESCFERLIMFLREEGITRENMRPVMEAIRV